MASTKGNLIVLMVIAMIGAMSAKALPTDDRCNNVKNVMNNLLTVINKEYTDNLMPYYRSIAPTPVNVFDDKYVYFVKDTNFNCYVIYETLNFLLGDVYSRATTNSTVALSLAKIALGSQQASMIINLCRRELGCGPEPFNLSELYIKRHAYGADNIMSTLDIPFKYFVMPSNNVESNV